jgi:AcrR family transcriptional regulator
MLAAALALFSQKGYHNVSMQEVAEKAEFAVGTLYKFFQNKEDLYRALVLEQCDNYEAAISQAVAVAADEVEKLRHYVRAKTEWCRSNLPFVRLFLTESRGSSFNLKAGFNDELRQRYYNFMEVLASILERGMHNQRFNRIAAPYFLAVALESVVDASLLLWLDDPERHPYPENPDTIMDIFFRGLINPQFPAGVAK